MNYRTSLLASVAIGGIGTVVSALIVLTVDPVTTDLLARAAFFTSVFLALSGFLVPFVFWGRITLSNREVVYAQFPTALRQGILVALFLTALLLLQSLRALSFWDVILMVAGVGFTELALRSRT